MKRRTLLKTLLLAPVALPFVKLLPQLDSPATDQIDSSTTPRMGELFILSGGVQTGKTTLAEAMGRRHGFVVVDDVTDREHPFEDCARLMRSGKNVLAVVSCIDQLHDSFLINAVSPEEVVRLYTSADCDASLYMHARCVFHLDYRRNDGLYALSTLKDCTMDFPTAFVWTDRPDFTCLVSSIIDAHLCPKA